jgi:alkylhydroperoxidase/carboxymuconolactone decarboxylase family protein YurZ
MHPQRSEVALGQAYGSDVVEAPPAVLLAVLTHLLPFVGYPRTLNALRVLDDVAPAPDDSSA